MRLVSLVVYLFITFFLILFSSSYAQNWQITELDSSSTNKFGIVMAKDNLDSLYIMYQSGGNLHYQYGSYSNWSSGSTGIQQRLASIQIDTLGQIHGVGLNPGNTRILYCKLGSADTLIDTVSFYAYGYTGPSIALDASGRPAISFCKTLVDSLFYGVYEGSNWSTEGIAHLSPYASASKIAIRGSDNFIAAVSSAITYAKYHNGNWQTNVLADQGIEGLIGFDLDNENHGYIPYNRNYNQYLGPLNLLYETDTGWTNIILDTSGTVYGGGIGIKFDQQNNINIVYAIITNDESMRYLKYAYRHDNSWNYEFIDSMALGFPGAMEITSDGSIHIAYLKANRQYENLFYAYRQNPQDILLDSHPIPRIITLSAYANPFNSSTTLSISNGKAADISIYDITGRQIATLFAKEGKAVWDASAYSSGVYFAKASGQNNSAVIKLIYLK